MALPHAKHLDVINVGPLGEELHGQVSTSLIKTDRIQLLHMVLGPGQDQPQHHVDDECTIHCLEGEVEVRCVLYDLAAAVTADHQAEGQSPRVE